MTHGERVRDEDLRAAERVLVVEDARAREDLLDAVARAPAPVRPRRLGEHLVAREERPVALAEGVAGAAHVDVLHQPASAGEEGWKRRRLRTPR